MTLATVAISNEATPIGANCKNKNIKRSCTSKTSDQIFYATGKRINNTEKQLTDSILYVRSRQDNVQPQINKSSQSNWKRFKYKFNKTNRIAYTYCQKSHHPHTVQFSHIVQPYCMLHIMDIDNKVATRYYNTLIKYVQGF